MDAIWWYIGAGASIGGIQLVVGIAVGMWMRRGGSRANPTGSDDLQQAQVFARELAELTSNVTRDVDRHNARIDTINDRLGSAKETPGDSLTHLVVGVVGELMRANQDLQTQLTSAEAELVRQTTEIEDHLSKSMTDELTGLPNRRAFDDAVQMRLKGWRHHRVPFTLMLLDIDHFKRVNDKFGHVAGDRVLCSVCDVVRTALRKPDLVTRIGGEEFAVLLPYTTLEDSVFAATKVLLAVASAITRSDGEEIRVTTSVGLASVMDGENATELVKRADQALYASKGAGRNCGHTHDGSQCHLIESANAPSGGASNAPRQIPPDEAPQLSPEMEAICSELRDRAIELAAEVDTATRDKESQAPKPASF